MSGRFNEGKALDAVLRHIEARDGTRRKEDGRSPEKDGHVAPVDFACTIGRQLYALEHTGIEPFPDQIEMEEHNRRLFGPVTDQLTGTLEGAESYQLHVPVDATVGLKRGQHERIQATLVDWVREVAPTLPIAPYGRYALPIKKITLPGVPFAISLHRMTAAGPMRRVFQVCYLVSGDLETARRKRLQETCAKKFGKLSDWRASRGARTVLVLEDVDIQLTNEQLVGDALSRAEEGRTDRPDEIYMVISCCGTPWWVTCLRRAGKTYYDDGEFWEVNPATLMSLTGR